VNATRRSFLVGTGAAACLVSFGSSDPSLAAAPPVKLNAWVSVGDDGIVTVMSPASELGQGIMTTLPAIIAEELDADWKNVRIVQSPSIAQIYGSPGHPDRLDIGIKPGSGVDAAGMLATWASDSVISYWDKLRLVGAQTRKVLLWNAAQMWSVPLGELVTEPGAVIHPQTGRRIAYGFLAQNARIPDPLPAVTKDDLKKPSQYRYLGKDLARVDVPLKVNGSAKYGIDVQLPNMLYASVLHPAVQGESPLAVDDAAARKVKGVRQIVRLPNAVAVVGDTIEGTMKAKRLLKVTWSNAAQARTYSTAQVGEQYRAMASDPAAKAVVMANQSGPTKVDAPTRLASAAKVVKATFVAEHVAHAPMEPRNATVKVDGDRAEIWVSTQSATLVQTKAAAALKIPVDNVTVHRTFIGGAFGGRMGHEIPEAALIAQAVPGRPVKMIWSREDDLTGDPYRPLAAQEIQVGLDAQNEIVGWRQRVVCASYYLYEWPKYLVRRNGRDNVVADAFDFVYEFPAFYVDYVEADRGIMVGSLRGTSSTYMQFAVEQVLDEVAALKGVDPVALRLSLLKKDKHAADTIAAVAKMADWGKARPAGRALGVAYSFRSTAVPFEDLEMGGSHVATAAEVSVDRTTGRIRVHKLWGAIDVGMALQPRNVESQFESAMMLAYGGAFAESIDVDNGVVRQKNFDTYHVPRMADMPQIEVRVISAASARPMGVGDIGGSAVAPAIANAFAKLTGKRVRHQPMSPAHVLAALRA
jgi:isoquinoline 1-oxidoreductase beta subunit